ncbi:unnamed protein product [Cuscuta campestris]|uniref:BTB domain-containing protein n=1 Tax=Cuscuta campestris TaxID=132261 RepID=A0A484KFN3_9ASTE|nr:unnamed protein product [Cuscuta campestris]
MPPFAGSMPPSNGFRRSFQDSTVSSLVTIDVGGQLFQTTKQTLTQAGSKSLFSKLANSSNRSIPFIDRDPDLFSVLLSLLRSGNLPSRAKAFDFQDLIFESRFYGVEQMLINSQSNPSQFDPFNLEKSVVLPLNGRDSPASISATRFGSVHVAHGSKVTSFDWALQRKSTVLTQFAAVDSLLALSPKIVAAGATDFSGVQILDVDEGFVRETLNWENVTRSDSTVLAMGSSDEYMFTSFESGRRNSSCIMVYDLKDSFRPVAEIGHYEIFRAELDSAIPATKLRWIPGHNLLMASGSHSGPAGVSGDIKFWDLRSGTAVWEVKEKVDCFSDVTALDGVGMFKVGVHSGEVSFADFRTLGGPRPGENIWTCLGDARKAGNKKKEGTGCRIESHGNQVFCSKGGQIELWSEVIVGSGDNNDTNANKGGVASGRIFRKNGLGRANDASSDQRITHMTFGGNKMFVTRRDQHGVEVWKNCVNNKL